MSGAYACSKAVIPLSGDLAMGGQKAAGPRLTLHRPTSDIDAASVAQVALTVHFGITSNNSMPEDPQH